MNQTDYRTKARSDLRLPDQKFLGGRFGKRPSEEDKPSPEAKKLIEQLEGYQSLASGWDSRQAKPLSEVAIGCIKSAIIIFDNHYVEFQGISLGVADDVDIRFFLFGNQVTVSVDTGSWEWAVITPEQQPISGCYDSSAAAKESFAKEASTALFQALDLN